jgi:hypothetical protein
VLVALGSLLVDPESVARLSEQVRWGQYKFIAIAIVFTDFAIMPRRARRPRRPARRRRP